VVSLSFDLRPVSRARNAAFCTASCFCRREVVGEREATSSTLNEGEPQRASATMRGRRASAERMAGCAVRVLQNRRRRGARPHASRSGGVKRRSKYRKKTEERSTSGVVETVVSVDLSRSKGRASSPARKLHEFARRLKEEMLSTSSRFAVRRTRLVLVVSSSCLGSSFARPSM
jgi:hypothetical protein